jgi:hypothetical protein
MINTFRTTEHASLDADLSWLDIITCGERQNTNGNSENLL